MLGLCVLVVVGWARMYRNGETEIQQCHSADSVWNWLCIRRPNYSSAQNHDGSVSMWVSLLPVTLGTHSKQRWPKSASPSRWTAAPAAAAWPSRWAPGQWTCCFPSCRSGRRLMSLSKVESQERQVEVRLCVEGQPMPNPPAVCKTRSGSKWEWRARQLRLHNAPKILAVNKTIQC